MTIEKRIKDERLRLGFNQPDFAAIAGKTKKTMIDYEKGTTSPDAKFLAAIASVGADVQYILTGIRSGEARGDESTALSRREKALIENLRACAEEDIKAVERMALRGSEAQLMDLSSGRKKSA